LFDSDGGTEYKTILARQAMSPLDQTSITMIDNFCGAIASSGALFGQLLWFPTGFGAGATGFNNNNDAVGGNAPCGVRLDPGSATTGAGIWASLMNNHNQVPNNFAFGNTAGWEAKYTFSIQGGVTNTGTYVGFSDVVTAPSTTNASNLTDWIGLRYDTGLVTPDTTNFKFVTCAASVCNTVDTGKAIDTSVHTIRIRSLTAGTILWSIDGGSETSTATDVPTASLGPAVCAISRTTRPALTMHWFGLNMPGMFAR
jgi:hypothetical protein